MAKEKWFLNKLTAAIKKIGYKKLGITRSTYSILISLADYADKNGFCWPLQSQLENDSGVLVNHQSRCFKELKNKGYITVKRKYDRRTRMTRNYYTIKLDAILTISMGAQGDLRVDGIAVKPMATDIKEACSDNEPNTNMVVDPNTNMVSAIYKTTHKAEQPITALKAFGQTDRLTDSTIVKMPNSLFDSFWAAYPRKQHRLRAMKIWQSKRLDEKWEIIIQDILNRTDNDVQWRNKEYIPHASTYLSGECWNDEIIGDQNERTKTNNTIHRTSKTEEAIIRGFEQYERDERKRRGIS